MDDGRRHDSLNWHDDAVSSTESSVLHPRLEALNEALNEARELAVGALPEETPKGGSG